MPQQSQRQRIRRLARSFVRAKERFADQVYADESECRAAFGKMLTSRAQLVDAVLHAVGHDLVEGPAVVDVGRYLVAVGESPEDEGARERFWDPSVIVIDKARIVRLGRDTARA
jgi:hypothetical protein